MSQTRYRNTAIVLEIKERFFVGFGKNERIKTAWSLAGARLFAPWRESEAKTIVKKLAAKGIVAQFVQVHLDVRRTGI